MARIVTDYLDEIHIKYPNKVALAEENRQITFSELRSESRRIATFFAEKKAFGRPVAVYLDKGIDVITSFLGCAYSGNFYSPIDPEMPEARVRSIFETLQPEFIISSSNYIERVSEIAGKADVVDIADLMTVEEDNASINSSVSKITDKDILYVLFTSGSTGRPKGVVISHLSTISYTEWASKAFNMSSEDTLGNQTPFYFSMSVFDIYQTISQGCTMQIIPRGLFTKPDRMIDYLESRNVNTIYWVPAALSLVAKSNVLARNDTSFLKRVLFAGEVMPNSVLNIWRKANRNALYANLFGPTELTDICTYYVVDREFQDEEPLPIGKACLNTGILVLDKNNNLIEEDDTESVGELCVRGSILAYGYYHNEEKTKQVFVPNPLNPIYDEIIYRTGDLVKYNEYSELMYVGRKDFQVKVSGYRIELGEIETAVSSIPSVILNCCLFDSTNQLLVLFYEGNENKREIREKLKKLLPRYMMPHRYVKLDNLPLNANGKIDRVELMRAYVK